MAGGREIGRRGKGWLVKVAVSCVMPSKVQEVGR